MADNMDMQSLVNLAAKSDSSWAEKGHKQALGNTDSMKNRCFDGFMKIFMKDDGKPSSFADKTKSKSSPSDTQSMGGSSASEGSSQTQAASQTDESGEAESDVADDALSEEDIAAAAAEAARLILSMMFPGMVPPDATGALPSMAQLSQMLLSKNGGVGGDSGLGAAGLSAGEAQSAISTANASAEMNLAGLSKELEEVLQGVPAAVLEHALKTAASGMGVSYSALQQMSEFQKLASALGMEVVESSGGQTASKHLLAELELAGMRQNTGTASAETAGTGAAAQGSDSEILKIFKEFLQQNGNPSSDSGDAGEFLDNFQAWVQDKGSAALNSQLSGDKGLFAQALIQTLNKAAGEAAAASGDNGDADMFSFYKNNLESSLLSKEATVDGAAAANPASQPQTTTASSMLDQIQNIERLAEAMRMSSRGGIKNLTLQLTPAELGKVLLKVEVRDGQVQAMLKVETRDAAAQLGANLQQLRDNLRAQGIDLAQVEIRQMHADDNGGRGFGTGQGQSGQEQSQRVAGVTGRGNGEFEPDLEDEAVLAAGAAAGPGALNLFA